MSVSDDVFVYPHLSQQACSFDLVGDITFTFGGVTLFQAAIQFQDLLGGLDHLMLCVFQEIQIVGLPGKLLCVVVVHDMIIFDSSRTRNLFQVRQRVLAEVMTTTFDPVE